MATMVGILSGAITNTPGLGAAQEAYGSLNIPESAYAKLGADSSFIGTAYAMSYPLGVIGIIFSIILIRIIFKIDINQELNLQKKSQVESQASQSTQVSPSSQSNVVLADKHADEPHLIPIFVGIFLGVILGSIPVYIPGVPQPVKLGLAGGPLVVAILMSAFGPGFKFPTKITKSAVLMLREVGICLFLACVGLFAGEKFAATVINGGLIWVGLGVIITLVPLLTVGILAYKVFKVDYHILMGMIAGSTTDPPALSYSVNASGNDKPSIGYATVYPLTMFLRIMTAQLLILLFA
jgi:AspT/YidE/YbjL antiporter-like protein